MLVFLVSLLVLPVAGAGSRGESGSKVVVFGDEFCSSCERVEKTLEDVYGESSIVFYSLSENANSKYFDGIYSTVFPGRRGDTPLVGVFQDGELRIVTGGYCDLFSDENFWKNQPTDQKRAYYNRENNRLKNSEYVEKLFLREVDPESPTFTSLLLPVVTAAFADSVNPCALTLFLVFLTVVAIRLSSPLKLGLCFVFGVFLTYLGLGFGLRKIVSTVPGVRYLVVVFGIAVGLLEASNYFLNHGITLTPDSFSEKAKEGMGSGGLLERFDEGMLGAFIFGLATSLLLLPCTSGPYFVAISFISKSPILGVPLLLLYNFIFIIPFLAILLGTCFLSGKRVRAKKWWRDNRERVELVSGLVILALSLYLFTTL